MLKRILIIVALVVCPLLAFGVKDLPQAPDDQLQNATVAFDGQWLPDRDPAEIGANNFKTLQNMRYRPGGIEGVLGYSKVNTSVLTPYLKARVGYHFKKDSPSESHVLYQAYNTGLTASQVLQNETAIPSQGDFSATELHTDATSAGLGRFSTAPDGMAYCNGAECLSWSGDEMPLSGFFTITQIENASTYTLTFAAAADTIVDDDGGNFVTAGYRPGQIIDITGAAGDNTRPFTIKKISNSVATNDMITVVEDAVTDNAGDTGCTLTARIETLGYENAIDYTEAVNNTLTIAGNVAYIGGGNDSNTKLLLHCDGADASTTFTDSGATVHTVAAIGNAQIDVDQSKFGGASGYFDGTGDYLSIPDHADWFFDAGNFSIDSWVKFSSLPSDGNSQMFYSQYVSAQDQALLYLHNNSGTYEIRFSVQNGATPDITVNKTWAIPVINTWYHIAIIRGWEGNANDFAITVNGTQLGSIVTDSSAYHDIASAFEIGQVVGVNYFNGWIDEFRVSNIARWTSNFTPQARPYNISQRQQLVLSPRPLQGLKYYVAVPNTLTSVTTGKVWTGNSFSSLTIKDGTSTTGISLPKTGSMTFISTVGEAKPFHFEGAYLYAYLFELSAGHADIYHVTGDAAFQPIVNVWDEVYRLPVTFQFYDQSVPAYDDFTIAVSQYTGSAGVFGADIDDMTTSDHIIVMFEERMAALYFTMSSSAEVNINASIPCIEYHDGIDWVQVGTITDGTSGDDNDWEILGQSDLMSWNPPGEHEEIEQTLFGVKGYAYKITVSNTLSATVTIDTVFGLPAQSTVKPFKFPAQFKKRTLLCGFTEGNEGNRIDFSMPGTSDVWNGELSSMDGIQSIRVPGQGDLTCGTELYNRYGSNVFAFFLAFKNTETHVIAGDHPTGDNEFKVFPVSTTIGCPAPLTLATAEVGYEMTEGVGRQMAFWVSTAGPMKFDGGVMSPLVDADGNGVQTFFDPASSDCITFANIADARGWYDSTYAEYNIVFPGDSLWLVYDLIEKKWYRKVPATYPKCGFPVYDTNGVQYIYAGLDTGYMMRLENGNTWDSTGIAQTVETGDFFPSKDPWHKIRLRQFKIAAKDITESASLAMTHYADTATSGTSLTALNLSSGSNRIVRDTQACNLLGWSHRLKFEATTSSTAKGFQPLAWGYQWQYERDDN